MPSARRGTTLLDIVVTLAVTALLASFAIPRAATGLDRLRTRAAAEQVATAYAVARQAAILRSAPVDVRLDTSRVSVAVVAAGDTLVHRALAADLGVTMSATRLTSTFSALGMGWGSANATIVVRRGRSVDSVIVSRLGRVRRGEAGF